MAGVDHAYQYSVEVKSRFSLFLNDALNNEDPDLLISKIKSERTEKKKIKSNPAPEIAVAVQEPQASTQAPKGVASVKPAPVAPVTVDDSTRNKSPSGDNVNRGRGGSRGFGRFRARGLGQRQPAFVESADSAGDVNQRDIPFEPRGRGRGRARGFTRGRGAAYTDYRESDRQQYPEQHRPYRRDAPVESVTEENVLEAQTATEASGAVEPESEEVNGLSEEAEDKEVEEEPKSYTLQEYKALLSQTKPTVTLNSKQTRKPNDGKDVFKNMVVHRKVTETSDDEVEVIEKEPEDAHDFNIDVSYTDRRTDRGRGRGFARGGFDRGRGFRGEGRPRGVRGSRGNFRGDGRGRGFSRGMNLDQHAAPPVINSDQDFPTLK